MSPSHTVGLEHEKDIREYCDRGELVTIPHGGLGTSFEEVDAFLRTLRRVTIPHCGLGTTVSFFPESVPARVAIPHSGLRTAGTEGVVKRGGKSPSHTVGLEPEGGEMGVCGSFPVTIPHGGLGTRIK